MKTFLTFLQGVPTELVDNYRHFSLIPEDDWLQSLQTPLYKVSCYGFFFQIACDLQTAAGQAVEEGEAYHILELGDKLFTALFAEAEKLDFDFTQNELTTILNILRSQYEPRS